MSKEHRKGPHTIYDSQCATVGKVTEKMIAAYIASQEKASPKKVYVPIQTTILCIARLVETQDITPIYKKSDYSFTASSQDRI